MVLGSLVAQIQLAFLESWPKKHGSKYCWCLFALILLARLSRAHPVMRGAFDLALGFRGLGLRGAKPGWWAFFVTPESCHPPHEAPPDPEAAIPRTLSSLNPKP